MNGLSQITLSRHRLAGHVRREVFGVSLMTLAVLMAISMVLFLAELLGDLADGELLASTLLQFLLLRLPEAILLVAPLALVVGLLMGLGELAQAGEFTIMRSSGLEPGRLLRVALGVAASWAMALLLVGGWLAPWAEHRSTQLAERMADDLLLASIRPGQFRTLGGGKLTAYVRTANLDTGRLEGVFVHFRNAGEVEAIAAASGRLYKSPDNGARVLSLRDGVHIGHQHDGTLPMRRIEFERNDIQLPLMSRDRPGDPERRRYLPDLLGDGSEAARLELQRRLVPPIIGVVLTFFALPITLGNARGTRFGVVVVAVAIYLVYSNTANLVLVRTGGDAAGTGIWLLHGLALSLAMIPLMLWWRRW